MDLELLWIDSKRQCGLDIIKEVESLPVRRARSAVSPL